MTDAEKNEALARWAGFHWGWWHNVQTIQSEEGWRCPNNKPVIFEIGGNGELPDFLHSLDAQAKWLWPKLDYLDVEIDWVQKAYCVAIIATAALDGEDQQGTSNDTPAEACAEAILSLIGSPAEGVPS